jgi:hypothetical protein
MTCPLYESTTLKINVDNLYDENEIGNFNIYLVEEIVE